MKIENFKVSGLNKCYEKQKRKKTTTTTKIFKNKQKKTTKTTQPNNYPSKGKAHLPKEMPTLTNAQN